MAAKDGARGVWLGQREYSTITLVPALPNVRVVDTTAAGDAFNGGFLHGLIAGMTSDAAAALGNVVAGLTVARRGAVTSLPPADEVWNFFNRQHQQRRKEACTTPL